MMTPEEFAEAMGKIGEDGGIETNHKLADALLCKMLRELGYGAGVDEFENINKWYA